MNFLLCFCFCLLAYRYANDVELHHSWPLTLAKGHQPMLRFSRDRNIPQANQRWQHVPVSNPEPFSYVPSAITTQPRHFGYRVNVKRKILMWRTPEKNIINSSQQSISNFFAQKRHHFFLQKSALFC